MKKFILILLLLVSALTFTSCSNDQTEFADQTIQSSSNDDIRSFHGQYYLPYGNIANFNNYSKRVYIQGSGIYSYKVIGRILRIYNYGTFQTRNITRRN